MREHSKITPQLWIGRTGKALRGDLVSQVTRDYILTCPGANALGMYYMPIPTASHETGIPSKGVAKALQRLSEAEFCAYDLVSEWIFIFKMALFQIGEKLEPNDNRVKWIKNQLESLRSSPFFNNFLDLYRDRFHLQDVTPSKGASKSLQRDQSLSLSHDQSLILPDPEEECEGKTFDALWKLYPRKDGKQPAREAWRKLSPKERELAMADIPRRLDANWSGRPLDKLPHLATYLNQKRWQDELTADMTAQPSPSGPDLTPGHRKLVESIERQQAIEANKNGKVASPENSSQDQRHLVSPAGG